LSQLSTHQLGGQFFGGNPPLLCLSLKLLHLSLAQLDLFDRHGASFGPSSHLVFVGILRSQCSKLRFQQLTAQNRSLSAVKLGQGLD
jgi:hypothetical protein